MDLCGQFACILQALYRVLKAFCRVFADNLHAVQTSHRLMVIRILQWINGLISVQSLWWFKSAFCTENSPAVAAGQSLADQKAAKQTAAHHQTIKLHCCCMSSNCLQLCIKLSRYMSAAKLHNIKLHVSLQQIIESQIAYLQQIKKLQNKLQLIIKFSAADHQTIILH